MSGTRSKATVTLDRDKVAAAARLTGQRTMSDVIDTALDRLIAAHALQRDVELYAGLPPTHAEIAVGDVPVSFDLDDADVDYDALYAEPT